MPRQGNGCVINASKQMSLKCLQIHKLLFAITTYHIANSFKRSKYKIGNAQKNKSS